jgi:choline dehydrogenase
LSGAGLVANVERTEGLVTMLVEADFVVVGAGSAGCVVAARLSESGKRVALLEAGPRDLHPMIHVPAGIRTLLHHPILSWNFASHPEEGTNGRSIHWPRGRVLGGSSSINGLAFVRGNSTDYDGWAQMGCPGWSYDDVLPYFKKLESYRGGGEDQFRGRDGPVIVENFRTILPLTRKFVQAAKSAGHDYNPDYNGAVQDGVSFTQLSSGRVRSSAARAYLKPARSRQNLQILTGAFATRLLFEGRRCVGVAYRQGGQELTIRAHVEVIVSGGAVNSPHLLQLSGIGPAHHLRSIGVDVLHDAPGVGFNMADHYVSRIAYRVKGAETINRLARFPKVIGEVAKYIFKGTGALTFGVSNAVVFCRSREGLNAPDIQLIFTPGSFGARVVGDLEREPGLTVAVCPVRPVSRGTIMAESPDPLVPPIIRPKYMSAEEDHHVMFSGLVQAQEILSKQPISDHLVRLLRPEAPIRSVSDALTHARTTGATIYHPVGTCKMGGDPMAVVDPQLRVKGVSGLRVIDASIMPAITTGNTNAPALMIGEKGAQLILDSAM